MKEKNSSFHNHFPRRIFRFGENSLQKLTCYETTSIDRRWYFNRRIFDGAFSPTQTMALHHRKVGKYWSIFRIFFVMEEEPFFLLFPKRRHVTSIFIVFVNISTPSSPTTLSIIRNFSEAFSGTLQKFTKASSKLFCDELPAIVWGFSMENGRIFPQTHTHTKEQTHTEESLGKILQNEFWNSPKFSNEDKCRIKLEIRTQIGIISQLKSKQNWLEFTCSFGWEFRIWIENSTFFTLIMSFTDSSFRGAFRLIPDKKLH